MKFFFVEQLMEWNGRDNKRQLPWKGIKNPYFIWLSEIILQQTRAEQGLPYYLKFTKHYPSVNHLAQAAEDEVMKLWEGLGYYSRARNLHAAAQYISSELNGAFPSTYLEILKLKGVGPYTAAAIASFAFGESRAVVDGNVYRVLSRYFGIETPIDSTAGKKYFSELANELIDKQEPAQFNQAIMDFGAKQCKPQNPECERCCFNTKCVSLATGRVNDLPVKEKKIAKKRRYFYYLDITDTNGKTFIQKRIGKDIWRNLYEYPMLETPQELRDQEILHLLNRQLGKGRYQLKETSKTYYQTLTHRYINGVFLNIELDDPLPALLSEAILISVNELRKYAFPKIIDCYLGDKSLY